MCELYIFILYLHILCTIFFIIYHSLLTMNNNTNSNNNINIIDVFVYVICVLMLKYFYFQISNFGWLFLAYFMR